MMAHAQSRQCRDAAVQIVSRLVREDRIGGQDLAGCINHGAFNAGANAWVQAHGRLMSCRRGQQKIL